MENVTPRVTEKIKRAVDMVKFAALCIMKDQSRESVSLSCLSRLEKCNQVNGKSCKEQIGSVTSLLPLLRMLGSHLEKLSNLAHAEKLAIWDFFY